MKKVLFLMLAVAISMGGFAQKFNDKAMKSFVKTAQKPSEVMVGREAAPASMTFTAPQNMVSVRPEHYRDGGTYEDWSTMETKYDLQSNSAIGNRIAVWPDGSAAVVESWDNIDESWANRGTGYNFYNVDDEDFGDQPEEKVEPLKSGWPTIVAYGDGELLASHNANGTTVYYRATKGEGDWEELYTFSEMTWPRLAVSGPNKDIIHIVGADQHSYNGNANYNFVYYSRSLDGGHTWSEVIDPLFGENEDTGIYKNAVSADDYVMAANGNDVAILFEGYSYEVFYMISHDNGETWEKQNVTRYPVRGIDGEPMHAITWEDFPDGICPDTLFTSDNSHSISIDNNGVVHVVFGLFTWHPNGYEGTSSMYSYWVTYNHGIIYWNSEYVNEQGGHEIPMFGDWSGDAALLEEDPTLIYNGDMGIANTLYLARFDALCQADGYEHLMWFGYAVDENGDGEYSTDYIGGDNHVVYRSQGLASQPGISVDNNGCIAIIYNVESESRFNPDNEEGYRTAWVTFKDAAGQWYEEEINLSARAQHSRDEAFFTTACYYAQDGQFWFSYSADNVQGLYLDDDQEDPTQNKLWAVKVDATTITGWDGTEEHNAVNPMTAARVYPNPANGVLNIEVNAASNSDATMTVFNIMGQKVVEKNANLYTGINTTSINTNELSSGVYFVTVKANGFEKTMKFVVE